MKTLYDYNATVLRVIDGDSIEIDIDLGFSLTSRQPVRLYGINAPEVVGATRAAGLAARDWLAAQIPPGTRVVVMTVKPKDKYGRYLAKVFKDGRSLNDLMVTTGHAVEYMAGDF